MYCPASRLEIRNWPWSSVAACLPVDSISTLAPTRIGTAGSSTVPTRALEPACAQVREIKSTEQTRGPREPANQQAHCLLLITWCVFDLIGVKLGRSKWVFRLIHRHCAALAIGDRCFSEPSGGMLKGTLSLHGCNTQFV